MKSVGSALSSRPNAEAAKSVLEAKRVQNMSIILKGMKIPISVMRDAILEVASQPSQPPSPSGFTPVGPSCLMAEISSGLLLGSGWRG